MGRSAKIGTGILVVWVAIICGLFAWHWLRGPSFGLSGRVDVTGSASVKTDTYKLTTVALQCSDKVDVFAGTQVTARYVPPVLDWFGSFAVGSDVISKSVPLQGLVCSQGLQTPALVTYHGARAVEVQVTLPTSQLQQVAVNDLSVDMCLPLPANATQSQIRAARASYKKGTCNLESRATGLLISEGTSAQALEFSRQLADLAGVLEPMPAKALRQVVDSARTQVTAAERAQYPGAKVHVTAPAPTSTFGYVRDGWRSVSAQVRALFSHVTFTQSHGKTLLTIQEGTTTGTVTIDARLTAAQIKELNRS